MTFDELKTSLTKLISEPDTATLVLPELLEKIKTDYETHNTVSQKVAEQEERIKTLQDTNMRLFLMQTGQATEQNEEPELQGTDAVDAFVKELMLDKSDK